LKQPKTFPAYRVVDLGRIDFLSALAIQKKILQEVIQRASSDTIIFCEHPATITLGRLAREDNILAKRDLLNDLGIPVVDIDRGGDVTLHSWGQLVVYPIFNLVNHGRDLKKFLFNLEQVVIDFLQYFGIKGERRMGFTGVWIGNKKIASIGIGVRKWVTFHGIAININNDLDYFSFIRPCGMDVEMTSLNKICGREVGLGEAEKIMANCFKQIFYFKDGGSHD